MSGGLSAGERAPVSRWHRLRHTPLRDVLRGRLSGRLDVEQVIHAFELPDNLAELVRITTRRTRLWRLEKVEVARELAAHFRDGIEAGATPDDLARSFGSPRQAARLIRRAKVRNRLTAKAATLAIRSILGCFALLVIVYIGLVIRLHTGSPTLSRNHLAELNAPILATPKEDRAWPLYRQAFLTLETFPKSERLDPADERWPELVEYAERHADAIELLHRAARLPHLGRVHGTLNELEEDSRETGGVLVAGGTREPPAEENPWLIEVRLPELSYFRTAARTLIVDALVAAGLGHSDRTYRDLETILMMIEHVSEPQFLITDLVAIAMFGQSVDSIGIILRDHSELFSNEQLVQLSHRLAGVCAGGPLRVTLATERRSFEDAMQRLYTDDGSGDGRLAADAPELLASLTGGTGDDMSGVAGNWFLGPACSAVIAGRREVMRKYDELMSAMEAEALVPMWERKGSASEIELVRLQSTPFERLRYLPIAILMPSLSRASMLAEQATQRRDGALAALACELYRRHNGRWPDTLAELSPHYLPSPPVDRFDGKPLRYRLTDGQPVIYSIGADCDDDGGRPPEGELARQRVREWHYVPFRETPADDLPDGDWILWPPGE